jgi:hypothetical protein
MLLQFERHFSIAHDSIFGDILSSPNFGGGSSFSGSGGRSSEDNSVLEVGRDRVECGGEAGDAGIYVLLSGDFGP